MYNIKYCFDVLYLKNKELKKWLLFKRVSQFKNRTIKLLFIHIKIKCYSNNIQLNNKSFSWKEKIHLLFFNNNQIK